MPLLDVEEMLCNSAQKKREEKERKKDGISVGKILEFLLESSKISGHKTLHSAALYRSFFLLRLKREDRCHRGQLTKKQKKQRKERLVGCCAVLCCDVLMCWLLRFSTRREKARLSAFLILPVPVRSCYSVVLLIFPLNPFCSNPSTHSSPTLSFSSRLSFLLSTSTNNSHRCAPHHGLLNWTNEFWNEPHPVHLSVFSQYHWRLPCSRSINSNLQIRSV